MQSDLVNKKVIRNNTDIGIVKFRLTTGTDGTFSLAFPHITAD